MNGEPGTGNGEPGTGDGGQGNREGHSAQVLGRLKSLERVGSLPRTDADVGTGEAGALDGGALTRIQVRVNREHRRIVEARFKVFGCSAAIASASLVAEWIEGGAVADALAVSADDVVTTLGLPGSRRDVAERAVNAARAAVADWQDRHD